MSEVKTYGIIMTIEDGKTNVMRRSNGFNAWELLGILEQTQLDILKQLAGEIKPDVIKREVVEPGNSDFDIISDIQKIIADYDDVSAIGLIKERLGMK